MLFHAILIYMPRAGNPRERKESVPEP